MYRQADDVVQRAFDAVDEAGRASLHGVGAGLVQHLVVLQVGVDFTVQQVAESHLCTHHVLGDAVFTPDAHPREHVVPMTGKAPEHDCRLGKIAWLAEGITMQGDQGVGGDHRRTLRSTGLKLQPCQPAYALCHVLPAQPRLVDMAGSYLDRQAGGGEQP